MQQASVLLLLLLLLLPVVLVTADQLAEQPCYMVYRSPDLLKKSIDFENPTVFELLASEYSRARSPFFELLHRERDCITLVYGINDEPNTPIFRGQLLFGCGVHELLHLEVHHQRNGRAAGGFCLALRFAGRPLEQYDCPMLGMTRTVPIVLQAQVGSMLLLAQETPATTDYLLFQRTTKPGDMVNTLANFAAAYNRTASNGNALVARSAFRSVHWLRCNCERIRQALEPLYRCLGHKPSAVGLLATRHPGVGDTGEQSNGTGSATLADQLLVLCSIGVGAGVVVVLLLKIRSLC